MLAAIRHVAAGAALGRLGDRCSHELLAAEIRRRHPDDAILSEEGADDRGRLTARRVWIVDPLDGTPLRYNRPDPSLPDLLVCRPEIAGALLEALAVMS